MVTAIYTLRITVPSYAEIDEATLAEIHEHADSQDTWSAKVTRFLGGPVSDAESALATALPEGWTARIDAEFVRV